MPTDEEIRDLRLRISQAQQSKTRAQMATDQALERKEEAVRVLVEEFGVTDRETAKAMLVRLRDELTAEVDAATEALEAAGA